jgi:AcrR family transcriptional regulator
VIAASSRARQSVDVRRAQLIELGIRLFSERPYDSISIDEIAREAAISKGLLYHYFGGKRDFYVACLRFAADQLLERTLPDEALVDAERARAGLEAYLSYVEERAGAYSALTRGGIGSDPEVQEILERTRRTIVDRMLESMRLREPSPIFRVAVRSWIGQVEAACLEWLGRRDVPREKLVKLLLGALFGTLLAAKSLDPQSSFELAPPPPWFFE